VVQALQYRTYHMTDPAVFYTKEDVWDVPSVVPAAGRSGYEDDGLGALPMEPYYVLMRLPGEQSPEFVMILPFTLRGRTNLAGWMAARCDPPRYGQTLVYRFPRGTQVLGPADFSSFVNQDTTISPQISLLSQRGSTVRFGNLLTIPVDHSLLFVQPLYVQASSGNNRIPAVKQVIVGYGDRVAMRPTLEAALEALFLGQGTLDLGGAARAVAESAGPGAASSGAREPMAALAQQARRHFDAATEAQRAGDWARYGQEIKLLGDALHRMEATELRRPGDQLQDLPDDLAARNLARHPAAEGRRQRTIGRNGLSHRRCRHRHTGDRRVPRPARYLYRACPQAHSISGLGDEPRYRVLA
jgi:uncharacterized membrane protein (UPF0182 family)